MKSIHPCLWFDGRAEEAARFYVSVFPDSKIGRVSRWDEAAAEVAGQEAGSVMMVEFELSGQRFQCLNGGPQFQFTEAVSFVIECADQEEVDRYWNALTDGGEESQCGWLKDRFGVSWQIVPVELDEMLSSPDGAAARRAMKSLLTMKKIDLPTLRRAFDGGDES